MRKEARWIIAFVVLMLALLGWSGDFVSLQGEKTVYTVNCDAAWSGTRCPGRMSAGERYRFRALRVRHEVIFWQLGSEDPSGKFTGCDVQDGKNWVCKASADASRTITLAMAAGRPQHDVTGAARPFMAVSKWKWWLLQFGLGAFSRADY